MTAGGGRGKLEIDIDWGGGEEEKATRAINWKQSVCTTVPMVHQTGVNPPFCD